MTALTAGLTSPGVNDKLLGAILRELFPYHKIFINERREGNIVSKNTDQTLELDFFIKDLKLAFEYQDSHHYITTWYYQKSKQAISDIDKMKQKAAEDQGISLISVPCWWDGSRESLVATIKNKRPELFKDFPASVPIPNEPPDNYFFVHEIPGIGELMAPVFPSSSFVPNSWWLSEKYDGIRACWQFEENALYSRYSRKLYILQSVKKNMPRVFLDSEIWLGRRTYQETSKLVRNEEDQHLFVFFRVITFDSPAPKIRNLPFEERMQDYVFSFLDISHPFIIVPAFVKCKNKKHMKKFVEFVLKDGGEGIVAKQPESKYEGGKSNCMIKVKAGRDQEALIVGVDQISYILQMPNGFTFESSMKNLDYARKPKLGDVVSYSYEKLSKFGEPVHPLITRVRDDVAWDMVLYNYHAKSPQPQYLNAVTTHVFAHGTSKPHGFWTIEKGKNIRAFFENFATKRKRDSLNPRSWYNVTALEILASEGGRSVLSHYGDSVIAAIKDVYPNIGLVDSFFTQLPQDYFQDFQNRKQLFDDFSYVNTFSPLVGKNWIQPQVQIALEAEPNMSNVLRRFYSGKIYNAIQHIYPNATGLEALQTVSKSGKDIFEQIARKRGFDPAIAQNWYSVSKQDILCEIGGFEYLVGNESNFVKDLMKAYPETDWDESKFEILPRKYWRTNKRKFLEEFANKKGFDALDPEPWYSVTKEMLLNEKWGSTVLGERTVATILAEIFPEIKFDEKRFSSLPKKYFQDKKNRISFFREFATKRGFDPLDVTNWYSITRKDIIQEKGGKTIIKLHNGSLALALVDVFPNLPFQRKLFANVPRRNWYKLENE